MNFSWPKFAALAPVFLLQACGGNTAAAAEGTAIACRLRESHQFTQNCRMVSEGDQRIIYHPDGGFRRLTRDGSGWRASDGADIATMQPWADGLMQVDIAGDSYRLPAS